MKLYTEEKAIRAAEEKGHILSQSYPGTKPHKKKSKQGNPYYSCLNCKRSIVGVEGGWQGSAVVSTCI